MSGQLDAPKPHRAHEVDLHISADSMDDLQRELEIIATKVERGEFSTWGVSGGYGAGHRYEHRHDPEMTHDRWAEENEAYCKAIRAAKQEK